MKLYYYILFLSSFLFLSAFAQTSASDDQVTLTDLFYGMKYDEETELYTCSEPSLEKFSTIDCLERSTTWYIGESFSDAIRKQRVSLGLYIDKDWPSESVQRRIEEAIDTTLIDNFKYLNYYACGYDTSLPFVKRIRTSHIPKTTGEIFAFANDIFNAYSEAYQQDSSLCYEDHYEGRICIVAHKIYEDSSYATYIVEDSYNYGGTCGCPSKANYYTIDKASGQILTANEVLASMSKKEAFQQIKRLVSAKPDDYPESFPNWNMNDFLDSLSGAALVNEGYLLYYLPYSVGCGADGEPLFVLHFNRK